MKSRAAVLTECGSPLELMDLEIPELQEGQVLVQMKYSGICRSQLNEIQGLKGPDRFLPHTLGHEGSGIVVDLGPGVTKVKKDDPVILTWIKGEGIDAKGPLYTCGDKKINSGPISTFLEYAVVAENRLIPIPKKTPLKEASLFGCAIPTGAGIIYNELKLTPNSTVALFGLGGIGLSALIAARAQKAKKIVAIDLNPSKLKLAKELGATDTLVYNEKELLASLDEITGERGVDFAVEAVGKKGVMELAFKAVKDQTGLCVLAGNVAKDIKMECDPFDFIKGKRLIGTWGGRVKPDRDIPFFLKAFHPNHALSRLISHEAPLSEINTLVSLLDSGQAARTLVTF